jgi:hypothetical protein
MQETNSMQEVCAPLLSDVLTESPKLYIIWSLVKKKDQDFPLLTDR